MKDFVIVGAGDFADFIVDIIENDMNRNIAAYVIDKKYITEVEYKGKPVYAFEDVGNLFDKKKYTFAIGFLGGKMYEQRWEKFVKLKDMGYELENVIHSSASISKNSIIGEGNILFQYTILSNNSSMGDCNVLCSRANISHDVKVGNANYFAPAATTTGYCEVGNNCFVGVNSALNNKVKIANYTFIGGGLFITNDTNEYDVYVPQKSTPLPRIKSTDFQLFALRRSS